MVAFPVRGQKAPQYWDEQLKAYIDAGETLKQYVDDADETVRQYVDTSVEALDIQDVEAVDNGNGTVNLTVDGGTITVGQTDAEIASAVAAGVASKAVPRWQPNTPVTAGQVVLSPSGYMIQARASFTTGSTFSATNWKASTESADLRGRTQRALRYSRPGAARRVLAPAGVSWLNPFIRVYFDGHKFFTDYDVTINRHTGTKWYSDRDNGALTNSGRGTTLTTPLVAGVAVTSLTVAALPAAFPSGSKVVIAAQDAAGVWRSLVATLSAAAAAAATTLAVTSVTPDFAFPAGALVANPFSTVFKSYSSAAAGDQLVPLDRRTNAFGGLLDRSGGWGFGEMTLSTAGTTTADIATGAPITSVPVTALGVAISAGGSITLESGTHSQTFVLSSGAAISATTISVVSQTPNFAYPTGTTVRSGNRITKSITIAPLFPGETKLIIGDWHGAGGASTWALKAGTTNVYTVTRSNARAVVDSKIGEAFGLPGMAYTAVANSTLCDATPGTYYISGSEVGVNFLPGGAPDPKRIHVLIAAEQFTARNENGDMSLYLADFSVYGGLNGNLLVDNVAGGNFDLYGYRMGFYWSVGTDGLANSVSVGGCRYVFYQNCKAAHSPKDGFNYAARDRSGNLRNTPKFIEVDCESWSHGIGNPIVASANTNNASTGHEGTQGLRIGGKYHETTGAVLADVQFGTETWNVECDVWDSFATSDTYNRAVSAQQSGATMHLWNVRAFGALYDIEAITGTIVNLFNCEYDAGNPSGGTVNVLASV